MNTPVFSIGLILISVATLAGQANDKTLRGTSVVRRLDWATGNRPRRGTDIAGCLQPAG